MGSLKWILSCRDCIVLTSHSSRAKTLHSFLNNFFTSCYWAGGRWPRGTRGSNKSSLLWFVPFFFLMFFLMSDYQACVCSVNCPILWVCPSTVLGGSKHLMSCVISDYDALLYLQALWQLWWWVWLEQGILTFWEWACSCTTLDNSCLTSWDAHEFFPCLHCTLIEPIISTLHNSEKDFGFLTVDGECQTDGLCSNTCASIPISSRCSITLKPMIGSFATPSSCDTWTRTNSSNGAGFSMDNIDMTSTHPE